MEIWEPTIVGSINSGCRAQRSRAFLLGLKIIRLRLRLALRYQSKQNRTRRRTWKNFLSGCSDLSLTSIRRFVLWNHKTGFLKFPHFLLDKSSTRRLIVYVHDTVYVHYAGGGYVTKYPINTK